MSSLYGNASAPTIPRQRIAERARVLAVAEAPLKLRQVRRQVLDANLAGAAGDRPAQQQLHALDGCWCEARRERDG